MTRARHSLSFITAIAIFAASPAWAWNLICGITIASAVATDSKSGDGWDSNMRTLVWDADSHAIRGISFSYLGISELQRIDLGKNGSFSAPQSLSGDGNVVQAAMDAFRKSSSEFETALASAKANHLGDAIGLTLLQQLHNQSVSILNKLTSEKSLPTLTDVQLHVSTMARYTAHGIELSQMHLQAGMPGHGEGGSAFKTQ